MGNFASSPDWIHEADALPMPAIPSVCRVGAETRPCIKPVPFFSTALGDDLEPQMTTQDAPSDLMASLITTAIETCKRSIARVFNKSLGMFSCESPAVFQSFSAEECDEWSRLNAVMTEFQATYEPGFKRPAVARCIELKTMTPHDVHVIDIRGVEREGLVKKPEYDDGTSSWTTEETDCWSDSEGEELDEGSCCAEEASHDERLAVLDELDRLDDADASLDVEQHATRLLRMASSLSPMAPPLYLRDYLCRCGVCPQYERIARDVETLVTWRSPAERQRITHVLQAFSTYNETNGYDAAMIPMADECLSVWCGDQDQAFKTLVLLHDEIPFLCASAV
ncbi:hypothetical protein ATCC90586_000044 [Pythium insidiosum]|nr:hypothetical protein ATCC90586_000044 [Pythium insidiosum]